MLTMILIVVIVMMAVLVGIMYVRTSKTMSVIDNMIDRAIDNTFSESSFNENELSKLEAKMYRYLSAGSTSLRQINLEKDRIKAFIADISHQTKTPISNILLYAQLLKEMPELDEGTRQIVSQIETQTEKLSFLISSLVKTSRLENGIIAVAPKLNSVGELLGQLDYEHTAGQKGVTFRANAPADLLAFFDFKWTLEALANIVDNAIKYTPSGGQITVSTREYEMFVCIDVTDSGIGMTEEETAKIFTRFYRSPRVYEERGVGIGLYLAREIVSKQGGYIKVTSELSRGSVFSVFLPKTPGRDNGNGERKGAIPEEQKYDL